VAISVSSKILMQAAVGNIFLNPLQIQMAQQYTSVTIEFKETVLPQSKIQKVEGLCIAGNLSG